MSSSKSRTNFVVTGHVDHGKSTFVGRLLIELGAIAQDRVENLMSNCKASGSRLEYSYLTDALAEEKNKGITIGVSHTVFQFENSEFVFIDAPGHYEFLQNMVTGASRADFAFLLIDANEGVKESSLSHMNMLSFLGVKDTYVLINKMDLVNYSELKYTELVSEIKILAQSLNLKISQFLPISAYHAENFLTPSVKMPWYSGLVVKDLFNLKVHADITSDTSKEFLFVVQDVYENTLVGERLSGEIENGHQYKVSDKIISLGLDENNFQGASIKSYKLLSDTKVVRGDIIHSENKLLLKSDSFKATLIWFGVNSINLDTPLVLRLAKQEVRATISKIFNSVDSLSLAKKGSGSNIEKGNLVSCMISLSQPIYYDLFENEMKLGKFILIHNGQIAGAGKINSLGS